MTQNQEARPQKYEESTDPLNPNYEGPVMVIIKDGTGPDGEGLVPENPKANLEDIL